MTVAFASELTKVEVLRTGTFLDRLSGIGGLPKGRLSEIFGEAGLGKTTTAFHAIANAQKEGLRCLFVDVEWSYENRYAEGLGVDNDKLGLIRERFAEDALDKVEEEIPNWDFIVLDSIGGLLPRTEAEKQSGESTIGGQAKLVARFCRKAIPLLAMHNTVLLVLNHSFQDLMSSAIKTSGGMKLEYHKSFSVRLRKTNKAIKQGEKIIGKVVIAQVRKNKVGPTEGMELEANLLLGQGFSAQEDTLAEAIERGIFTKDGNSYFFENVRIGVISKLREWMKTPENAEKIKSLL